MLAAAACTQVQVQDVYMGGSQGTWQNVEPHTGRLFVFQFVNNQPYVLNINRNDSLCPVCAKT